MQEGVLCHDRPLYIVLIITNLPPPAAIMPDGALLHPLQFPTEDKHGAWHKYNKAVHAILQCPNVPALTTAMRLAARACAMTYDTNCEAASPDLTPEQLVHDIWTTKEEPPYIALARQRPEERSAHLRTFLIPCRHQLQEWRAHHMAAAAREQERYRK